jgi:hypothetical protein
MKRDSSVPNVMSIMASSVSYSTWTRSLVNSWATPAPTGWELRHLQRHQGRADTPLSVAAYRIEPAGPPRHQHRTGAHPHRARPRRTKGVAAGGNYQLTGNRASSISRSLSPLSRGQRSTSLPTGKGRGCRRRPAPSRGHLARRGIQVTVACSRQFRVCADS